jgi:uncharacterized protein YxeA
MNNLHNTLVNILLQIVLSMYYQNTVNSDTFCIIIQTKIQCVKYEIKYQNGCMPINNVNSLRWSFCQKKCTDIHIIG